jgi:hypothetical protein
MERITIDVTRNRGSRSANIRCHVGPVPGQQGSSFVFATVPLAPAQMLTVEVATHIAHSVEQALRFLRREDIMGIPQESLPF